MGIKTLRILFYNILFLFVLCHSIFAQDEGGDAQPKNDSGFGIQAAWNNPTANLGVGQSKPGYSRISWEPGSFIPVRLRDGMTTLINFPDWEKIKDAYIEKYLYDYPC